MTKPFLPLVAAASLLAGCTLAPDYQRPALPTATAWPIGSAYPKPAAGRPAASIGWEDYFSDPKLRELIGLAITNNRDLRVTALNIEVARQQVAVQRSELFPTVAGTASANLQQASSGVGNTDNTITRTYGPSAGLSSWELDFFGRVQSLTDQAFEQYLATEEAQRSAVLSLVAEVATNYLTLAADQQRLTLAESTLKSQQASYDLTLRSRDLGTSTELAVAQARTSVETARADIARFTRQVAQDQNALTLTVGTTLPAKLAAPSALKNVTAFKTLPAGIPSDVLLNRPDILEAEHSLKAANADIGAARAAFFPSISLTASGGASSSALNTLFTGGSAAWAFAPQISVPIFTGGLNTANLRISETDKKIAVAQYEKAIQTGFREVADALAERGTIGAQLAAQQQLVKANQQAYDLSDARFRGGVDSYLSVLTSQQSLYSSQQDAITVNLQRLTNFVTLYKVLGGGWSAKAAPAAAAKS